MDNLLNSKLNTISSNKFTPFIINNADAAAALVKDEPERVKIGKFQEEVKKKEKYSGMDIVFVLDSTGSMGPYIEGAKESLKTIIEDSKESLKDINADESSLRFAVVAYRDHPPQENSYVTDVCDFCSSQEAEEFLKKVTASGGGDLHEAVMDGLNVAINQISWRKDADKFLFLVLDAPPHGKIFGNMGDGFPDGCPCGLSEVTLLPQLRDMKIDFTIIKVDSRIDTMIEIFSQYTNIEVFFPKLFQNKNNNQKFGSGGLEYINSVKSEMKTACNSKMVSNLMFYK
jgi:hypothetical protein